MAEDKIRLQLIKTFIERGVPINHEVLQEVELICKFVIRGEIPPRQPVKPEDETGHASDWGQYYDSKGLKPPLCGFCGNARPEAKPEDKLVEKPGGRTTKGN